MFLHGFVIFILFFGIILVETAPRKTRSDCPPSADVKNGQKSAVMAVLDEMGLPSVGKMSKLDLATAFGELAAKYVTEIKSKNKLGIIFFYLVRIDRLEWLATEDENVKKELSQIDQDSIKVPTGISEDGQQSYKSRYRVWLAIVKAMKDTRNTYLLRIKKFMVAAGMDTTKQEEVASIAATLYTKMSGEAKKDDSEIKFKGEDEAIAALKEWRITTEDEIKMARAVYRLNP